MPASDLKSPRKPWKAVLLSLGAPGLGQLYSGRPGRGLAIFLLSNLVLVGLLTGVFIPLKPWNILVPTLGLLLWWVFVLIDTCRCAKQADSEYRLQPYNRWYIYLSLFILVALVQHYQKNFIRAQIIQPFVIQLQSTAPTLVAGDHLWVDKCTFAQDKSTLGRILGHREPRRGDLVVFYFTNSDDPRQKDVYIKRVIAQPGDRFRIVKREVWVNGTALNEPYTYYDPAFAAECRPGDDFPPRDSEQLIGATDAWRAEFPGEVQNGELVVPPGKYFVMGDNREHSWDSRFWGFVPRSDIFGKADAIYFSWESKTHRVRWNRIGEIIK